jgi:exosortase K
LGVDAGVFAAALGLAFGTKAFYAGADADALDWILDPTALLVSALSGQHFEAEAGIGYLSRELALVIAPACAGLNYLVIAFSMLVFCFAPLIVRPSRRFGWLLVAAALAYTATVLVNALRIALSIALREASLPAWLSASQAHRLEGIAVYLGSLWLLNLGVARGFAGRADPWRAALLPLLLYLGVTLLVPFANGAQVRPQFWEHARVVLVASLALAAVVWVGLAAVRRAGRARQVSGHLQRPREDSP